MDGKNWYDLTVEDLLVSPIWVLSMDVTSPDDDDWDDDTALVVPLPSDRDISERLLREFTWYVRTAFHAPDGRHFTGLMFMTAEGVENDQPAIMTDHGQVPFYFGARLPGPEELTEAYTGLGIKPDQLFPLKYGPDISVQFGHSSGGVLEGFYYMDSEDGWTVKCIR